MVGKKIAISNLKVDIAYISKNYLRGSKYFKFLVSKVLVKSFLSRSNISSGVNFHTETHVGGFLNGAM